MQGLSLGVEGSGLVYKMEFQDKVSWVSFMYTVVMFMLYSDCGSAHCCGCVVNGISALRQHVECYCVQLRGSLTDMDAERRSVMYCGGERERESS